MTKLFELAIETARRLSPEAQDEIARVVLEFAHDAGQRVIQLTPEEEASFDESLAQAERGEFATDDQVRAVWAKHGL
jgi:predicted transcriptional regulator